MTNPNYAAVSPEPRSQDCVASAALNVARWPRVAGRRFSSTAPETAMPDRLACRPKLATPWLWSSTCGQSIGRPSLTTPATLALFSHTAAALTRARLSYDVLGRETPDGRRIFFLCGVPRKHAEANGPPGRLRVSAASCSSQFQAPHSFSRERNYPCARNYHTQRAN